MKKTTQILLTGGIILAVATLAFGWSGHHMAGYGQMNNGYHMGTGSYHMGGPYNGSGLTADEVKALNQERKDFFYKTREIRKEAYNTKLKLEEEFSKANRDTKKVEKLRNRLAELNNKIFGIHNEYSMMSQVKNRGFGNHMMRGAGYNGNGYCW